ncbi:Rtt106-domain-containing protein [Mollisia scopiformis]|uniref:Rtt106-domain-containing protein n=1 Tax=Mollisia scopiformis TaxID=149040 RepID=A0A194WVU5_MOLSC|nr:Rtt106-domain-containing protein [Mollisia scopiformis]KUJ12093.1 Rtt106-domain-containing protein [Mollisia scopiformis]
MASTLDEKSLQEAFSSRPDIQGAIRNAAAAGPHYTELFNQISLHVCSLAPVSSEPATKKRRLDENIASRPATNGTNGHAATNGTSAASSEDPVLLEVKDISVVIPQRKKYTLCFTSSHLYARLPDSKEPVPGISFAWSDIEYAFCLPVPEKTQKQYNYILFPRNSIIAPSKPIPGAPPTPEPIVFSIPDSAPKPGTISGLEAAAASAVSDDLKTLFDWALLARLKAAGKDTKIVQADEKLFASEQRQAHRPGEKAVHVKAFRGSKDGYLFFLPNGILWAFKKPMLFLPHERILAVSYTSVLQRTFNLSVEVDMSVSGGEESTEEFEFSMLDQEDFGGIDGFVKRHGLQDKSMAEQRKAKRLNVNVVKDEDGNVVGNVEAGELEKAALEAGGQEEIDEEDEEEEDYDPGSDGESEGSGSSSEEEDDDVEGGGEEEGDEEEDEEDDEAADEL